MSVYEKRYEVCYNRCATYFDTAEEVVAFLDRRGWEVLDWISEGYGDVGYQDESVTEIIRRRIGPVGPIEIQYRAARERVAKMLVDLKAAS